jgi:hypothetical protein
MSDDPASTVLCPYCYGAIDERAHACRHCGHDLYLFKPILNRIAALEKQLEALASCDTKALEARVGVLESELASSNLSRMAIGAVARSVVIGVSGESGATPATIRPGGEIGAASAAAPAMPPVPERPEPSFWTDALLFFGVTLALLLVAHILIVMVYDLKPLYLRVATLLLPLPFGFLMCQRHPRRFGATLAVSFVTAVAAVLGMSMITGAIDKVPILPRDLRELREYIEFSASIGFSFLTGILLGKLPERLEQAAPRASGFVLFIARFMVTRDGKVDLSATVKKVQDTVSMLTPVATAVISAVTGLRAFLGG